MTRKRSGPTPNFLQPWTHLALFLAHTCSPPAASPIIPSHLSVLAEEHGQGSRTSEGLLQSSCKESPPLPQWPFGCPAFRALRTPPYFPNGVGGAAQGQDLPRRPERQVSQARSCMVPARKDPGLCLGVSPGDLYWGPGGGSFSSGASSGHPLAGQGDGWTGGHRPHFKACPGETGVCIPPGGGRTGPTWSPPPSPSAFQVPRKKDRLWGGERLSVSLITKR